VNHISAALSAVRAEGLVGKLDATADRKASTLVINAIRHDVRITKAVIADLRRSPVPGAVQWAARIPPIPTCGVISSGVGCPGSTRWQEPDPRRALRPLASGSAPIPSRRARPDGCRSSPASIAPA
jgi:hypothetical protein